MRLWVLALAASGCFGKPGEPSLTGDARTIDGARPIDAGVTPHCANVPFGTNPVIFTGLQGAVAADPSINGNELQLFFTHGTTGMLRIWQAIRSSTTVAFMPPFEVTPLGPTPTSEQYDPAPTSDGQTFAYINNDTGVLTARLATFTAAAAPPAGNWSDAPMPGLEMLAVLSLDLSPDGKTLYWNDDAHALHIATWNSSTMRFEDSQTTYGVNFGYPAVSADGLELFYNGFMGINRAVRASLADPFVGLQSDPPIVANYYDPDISADGQMLVFADGNAAAYVSRSCQ